MSIYLKTSVSLSEDRVRQLDAACTEQGTTRASLIRTAVHEFLDRETGKRTNFGRLAMTSEFTQVAVDILIREQMPERREDILATVQDRMEKYHA